MEDGPDWANLAHAGLNAEGMALLSTAESEAQSALALIDQGRRTLKEARSKAEVCQAQPSILRLQVIFYQWSKLPAWDKCEQPKHWRQVPELRRKPQNGRLPKEESGAPS